MIWHLFAITTAELVRIIPIELVSEGGKFTSVSHGELCPFLVYHRIRMTSEPCRIDLEYKV
jgi:hypothetical protein